MCDSAYFGASDKGTVGNPSSRSSHRRGRCPCAALFRDVMPELAHRVVIKTDDGFPLSFDLIFELDDEQRRRPALDVDHDTKPCVRILDPIGIVDIVLAHPDHVRARRASSSDFIIPLLRTAVYTSFQDACVSGRWSSGQLYRSPLLLRRRQDENHEDRYEGKR